MRFVFSISRNEIVKNCISNSLPAERYNTLFPIESVEMLTSTINLSDYTRNLKPDLIIVDASGGFSAAELDTFFLWAKSQKERAGTRVLRIDPKTISKARTEVPPKGVDAVLSLDDLRSSNWPKTVMRWTYAKFHPGT